MKNAIVAIFIGLFLSFSFFACKTTAPISPSVTPRVAPPARVVAVGDVHGSIDGLVKILRETRLIDEKRQWIGENAILVQTGDLLDRGTSVAEVLDLMMSLQAQARASGGQVVSLLGNHEVMNLLGFFDYIDSAAMATFADSRSEERRNQAWKKWRRFFAAGANGETGQTESAKARWMETHPAGFVEYHEAFSSKGLYGRWLRRLPAMVQIKDSLFMHGGIGPANSGRTIDEINDSVKRVISDFDRDRAHLVKLGLAEPYFTLGEMSGVLRAYLNTDNSESSQRAIVPERSRLSGILARFQALYEAGGLFHENSPLWFRGYDSWPDEQLTAYVPDWLASLGSKRIVVSHTPQAKGKIQARLDGKIFLIDTGMLSSYYRGGQGSALEIKQGTVHAVYESGERVRLAPVQTVQTAQGNPRRLCDPDRNPLPFSGQPAYQNFLNTANISTQKVIRTGVNKPLKVLLEKDGVRSHAIFRYQSVVKNRERIPGSTAQTRYFRDSYISELAAYEINTLLEMNNFPPTVTRSFQGRKGSLQIWVEKTMTDMERAEKKILPPNARLWNQQMWDMRVFDNLINNVDRNQGNILIDGDWNIWLIDHTRSFAKDKTLPNPREVARCSRRLWEAIGRLDETTVRTRLAPHLRPGEIDALWHRRSVLIKLIEGLIQKKGEEAVIF